MVLYAEEFMNSQEGKNYSYVIKKFIDAEKYLHDMSADEIYQTIIDSNIRNVRWYMLGIICYLRWLFINYGFKPKDLIHDLSEKTGWGDSGVFLHSYEELLEEIDICMNDERNIGRDMERFRCICMLKWLMLSQEEITSVRLSDVKEDRIFVPLTGRTVYMSENIADIILNHKIQTAPYDCARAKDYKQETLIRTTRNESITVKTLHNIFYQIKKSRKLMYKNIGISAACCKLWELEQSGERITAATPLMIEYTNIVEGFNYNDYADFRVGERQG